MSKKAKGSGFLFEKHIEAVCETYEMQGRARIKKVSPPSIVKAWPRPHIVLLSSPFVDFIGSWTEQGGECINIEAKSTTVPRLPIANEKGVKPEQIAALKAWQEAKSKTGVLWEHGGEVRFVTVAMIVAAREKEEKSIAWDNAVRIPAQKGVSFDFLETLKNFG